MKEYFTTLLNYNMWATKKTIEWLLPITEEQWNQDIGGSFKTLFDTVLHVVSAEKLIFERLQGDTEPFLATTFVGTKAELLTLWEGYSEKLAKLISSFSEDDLQTIRYFKTLSGVEVKMEKYKLVAHIINHTTYHRGQIVNYLRQVGQTNLESTDLFDYYLRLS
ncbi:MAG: DinB family protein [Spirosomataceae bacterium]